MGEPNHNPTGVVPPPPTSPTALSCPAAWSNKWCCRRWPCWASAPGAWAIAARLVFRNPVGVATQKLEKVSWITFPYKLDPMSRFFWLWSLWTSFYTGWHQFGVELICCFLRVHPLILDGTNWNQNFSKGTQPPRLC